MCLRSFFLWLVFLWLILPVASCPRSVSQVVSHDANKPKIGLALEGGAALGLAHIGVLQWLEEHRIPVNYVAGTSMGGLIGGVYATGKSPDEIKELVQRINWDDVLRGQIPFQDLSYRRKEDAEDYPNGLEFGIKKGIRFPAGFNSGLQVGLILDSIALPYSEMKTFDEMPIPFACVATDLVSGKEHVFRDGSIGQALRATMSIPGVFTPVRTDTSIFVDGGLLDNLPVDVARAMGAELVIAVHLQTKSTEAKESLNSFAVLGRSMAVTIHANELRSMEQADILISVPLEEFGSSDYAKSAAIIRAGYESAARKAALLSQFSLDDAGWQQYLSQRAARQKNAPIPQFIEVTGTKPALAREIQNQLSGNDLGKPVDTSSLGLQLTRLAGVGRYSRLGYRMVERDDQQGLLVAADEKEYGPPLIRPIIIIDGTEPKNVQFALGGRITFLDVGSFGTEWRNDIILGSEYGVRSEFFHPLGEDLGWFIAPRAFASNTQENYYTGSNLIAEYRNRLAGAAFDIGNLFSRSSELRLGYEAAEQKFSPYVGSPTFGTLQGRIGTTSLRFNRIGRDEPVVPRSGLDLHFRTNWYDSSPGAKSPFALSEIQTIWFKPVSIPASVFISVWGGTTFTYRQVGFPPFSLGGAPNLLAYGTNEFLTRQYSLLKAGYIHKLTSLPPLIGRNIYVIGIYEVAKVWYVPGVSPWPNDIAGGLVVNTIFGPVLVGAAYGATGHHKFFYQLGRVF
jgi:NTE family protein